MLEHLNVNRIGRLCVITDARVQNRFTHHELALSALRGGADVIQFRDKEMSTSDMIRTAVKLRRLCKRFNALLIVNDRVDVALVTDADGVHLGADDIPIPDARKILGSKRIIGATAHSLQEAIRAEREGADYIGFGHIFPTESKFKQGKPKGIEELNVVCQKLWIPVLAIGGIDPRNAMSVLEAGAYGIAVIGSVARSERPTSVVRKLKKLCDSVPS